MDVQHHLIYWQGQRVCDAIFTQMFQCWAAIKNLHKTGVIKWISLVRVLTLN
jgi:hypothetical protein